MHHAVNTVFVGSGITFTFYRLMFTFKTARRICRYHNDCIVLDTEMENNINDQENSKSDADGV